MSHKFAAGHGGSDSDSPPGTGGVAAPSRKWSRSLLEQTGWSFQMRCFETHSQHVSVEEFRMNLYEAKNPLFGQGGEFQLILFSSFAANCLARSGSLNLGNFRTKQNQPLAISRRAGLTISNL